MQKVAYKMCSKVYKINKPRPLANGRGKRSTYIIPNRDDPLDSGQVYEVR